MYTLQGLQRSYCTGPMQGVYGIHITFCASRYVKVYSIYLYTYREVPPVRVQVQGVYHQSKYTKLLPHRVCIACCAVLRFKSQPISLLPFHLSRPSVGKNSDNHHNVKASQGAKVLFYNLVILNPWLYFRSPVKGNKHQITEDCHHHIFLL